MTDILILDNQPRSYKLVQLALKATKHRVKAISKYDNIHHHQLRKYTFKAVLLGNIGLSRKGDNSPPLPPEYVIPKLKDLFGTNLLIISSLPGPFLQDPHTEYSPKKDTDLPTHTVWDPQDITQILKKHQLIT